MAEVSLKGLENMFREGAEDGVDSAGCLTPEYSTVTKEEAEEIATALMVLRNVRQIEDLKRKAVRKISEDVENAYGLGERETSRLQELARDLITLNDVQRRN